MSQSWNIISSNLHLIRNWKFLPTDFFGSATCGKKLQLASKLFSKKEKKKCIAFLTQKVQHKHVRKPHMWSWRKESQDTCGDNRNKRKWLTIWFKGISSSLSTLVTNNTMTKPAYNLTWGLTQWKLRKRTTPGIISQRRTYSVYRRTYTHAREHREAGEWKNEVLYDLWKRESCAKKVWKMWGERKVILIKRKIWRTYGKTQLIMACRERWKRHEYSGEIRGERKRGREKRGWLNLGVRGHWSVWEPEIQIRNLEEGGRERSTRMWEGRGPDKFCIFLLFMKYDTEITLLSFMNKSSVNQLREKWYLITKAEWRGGGGRINWGAESMKMIIITGFHVNLSAETYTYNSLKFFSS